MVFPKRPVAQFVKEQGIERVGNDAVEKLNEKINAYIIDEVAKAKVLMEHAGRKTLKAEDFK
jgi:histone H3/H4